MQKYTKIGFGIVVDLQQDDALVRANILKVEGNLYHLTLELRIQTIPRWDLMDEEVFELESENINMDTYQFILMKRDEGYFDNHIKRYWYELQCFDKGVEILE